MTSTYALTDQDRELLGNASLAGTLRTLMGTLWVLTFAAFSAGIVAGLLDGNIFDDHWVGLSIAALVSFVLFIVAGTWTWKHQRRMVRPMREAIARNQKRIVSGTLSQVEKLPNGRLRYVVDGEAVEVDLLLKVDGRMSYAFGRELSTFQYLDKVPVELHCISLGSDINLLLQARYPRTQEAKRTARAVQASDKAWAGKKVRVVLIVMAIIGCFATMVASMVTRYFPYAPTAVVLISVVAWVGTLLFYLSPRQRHARNNAKVIAIEGPVTEILTARVRVGKTASVDMQWYRVGGALFCPLGAGVGGGPAELGQLVTLEFMSREGRRGDDVLMTFQTGVAPGVATG